MAATNTYHLAKKPASGGMPASENSSIAKKNASSGLVRDSPAKSLMVSTACPLRFIARMKANEPSVIAT